MKKNHILTTMVVIITAVILFACGNYHSDYDSSLAKPVIVIVHPASVQMGGDLGSYFEVADRDFVIVDNLLTIEVKRNMKDFSFTASGLLPYGYPGRNEAGQYGFGIELSGGAGQTFAISATAPDGLFFRKDAAGLMNLKKGESGFIRWMITNPENLKSFRLTSALSLGK